jgi:hypothetical protein
MHGFLVPTNLIKYQGTTNDYFSKVYNYYLETLRLSNNSSTTTMYVFSFLTHVFHWYCFNKFQTLFVYNIHYHMQYNYLITCIYCEGDKMSKEKKLVKG